MNRNEQLAAPQPEQIQDNTVLPEAKAFLLPYLPTNPVPFLTALARACQQHGTDWKTISGRSFFNSLITPFMQTLNLDTTNFILQLIKRRQVRTPGNTVLTAILLPSIFPEGQAVRCCCVSEHSYCQGTQVYHFN